MVQDRDDVVLEVEYLSYRLERPLFPVGPGHTLIAVRLPPELPQARSPSQQPVSSMQSSAVLLSTESRDSWGRV